MIVSQGGKCAICGYALYRPHIDHDHATGRVRAILCHLCNVGLGSFKDNPEALERAAEYVREHRGR